MKAPLCRVCGSAHWGREPHKFAVSNVVVEKLPAVVETTSTTKVSSRSADRHRDKEGRRQYQHDYYLRKKRGGG